jgi:hypothetical protein
MVPLDFNITVTDGPTLDLVDVSRLAAWGGMLLDTLMPLGLLW